MEVIPRSHQGSPVWLRITAFLTLKSPETRRTYSGIVSEWCRFLGAEPGTEKAATLLLSATDLHSAAYRRWLEQQPGERPRSAGPRSSSSKEISTERRASVKKTGLESTQSNATIHKKFAALRRIYRVLIANNLGAKENPFDSDRTPAPPKDAGRKRPTEMIDFDLVWEIVTAPGDSTSKAIRDRAILAILFGGGLRRSEVINLRLTDVRKSAAGTPYLYLRSTKAKKDAEATLPEWAGDFLNEHIRQRRAEGGSDTDYVFVGYTGQGGKSPTSSPISDTGVYQLFRSYCMQVGAGPHVTPHSARATAITKLLSDGVPHREVQAFSRHASIQMVEHYDKRRFDVERSPAKGLSYKRKTHS